MVAKKLGEEWKQNATERKKKPTLRQEENTWIARASAYQLNQRSHQ
jgi:hypothetical protein